MHDRAHQQPLGLGAPVDALANVHRVGEQRLAAFVGDEFDTGHQFHAAHIANQWQVAQALQTLLQIATDILDVVQQVFPLDDLDVLQRRGAADRVAAVGEAVGETPALARLGDHLPDPVGKDTGAQRQVGRGQALGGGDDVRLHAKQFFTGEEGAQAAKRGHHLVGHEENVVGLAHLPHAQEVVLGRDDHAA
ncbi:hypothetical protein D3C77_313070 [compost metagenome]